MIQTNYRYKVAGKFSEELGGNSIRYTLHLIPQGDGDIWFSTLNKQAGAYRVNQEFFEAVELGDVVSLTMELEPTK